MKVTLRTGLFILMVVLSPLINLFGQVNLSDSVFYQSAVHNAISFYQQSAGDQSRLYNGREYKPYRISFINGHPFFQTDQFASGSIIYDGGLYENVQLLYDEVKETIILYADIRIELITERIGQFTISGHSFTRLVNAPFNNNLNTGFYERLYSGKIEIYKKEKKVIEEDLSETEGVRGEIAKKKYYYLRKEGQYYAVKKKNHIYEILKDRKKEVQQFMKMSKLDFANDTDNTLVKIAGYYDQLTR